MTTIPPRRWCYYATKRLLDVAGAALGLILTSPIMLAAAVAIRLESRGPAIFKQTRVGKGGRPFTFYKFRGMYVDAKERFPELYTYAFSDEEAANLYFHSQNDPRVTRVGRFLRRTSIDELPNLLNVLIGDMSLVGPRPEIPEMLQYYGEHRDIILSVKPGVTSLAKCKSRDELTLTNTLELDAQYAKQQSLRLDLMILFKTVSTVLLQRNVEPG